MRKSLLKSNLILDIVEYSMVKIAELIIDILSTLRGCTYADVAARSYFTVYRCAFQ